MPTMRPFRFGVQGDTPPGEWIAHAKRVEELGYDVLSVGEHVFTDLAPIPALMAAAMATSTIRLGTATLANDFHNPVILARDITTLDTFSGGRLEFGIGSGFFSMDYNQTGVPLDPPRPRVDRLFEGVQLIKSAFRDETVDFAGEYYNVQQLALKPRSIQNPGPPLLIRGGGRRVLEFAAREADIVSFNARTTANGWFDWSSISAEATAQKVSWVRAAAGERFDDLELHLLVTRFELSDDPEAVASDVIARFAGFGPVEITVKDLMMSPYFLVGSEDAIVDSLRRTREEFGITYVTVFNSVTEEFAPIAARLREVA